MAQYIEHPALMGARMADQMSQQRMNLVGQGITQAADALNRQAAIDAQAVSDMMRAVSFMRARRNPVTGVVEDKPVEAIGADWLDPFMREQMRRRATIGGYDYTLPPTSPRYQIAPSNMPAAATPVFGQFGEGMILTPRQELMQGRAMPSTQPNYVIDYNKIIDDYEKSMGLPAIKGAPVKTP